MPWNPAQYDQFKDLRFQPFLDLAQLVIPRPAMRILDLGCGTGTGSAWLAAHFPDAQVLGIDDSEAMLTQVPEAPNLRFRNRTIEAQLALPETFDLILANASLQWVDDHAALFPELVARLNVSGQLAVQMPSQTENTLNRLLLDLVQEPPFAAALNDYKRLSPVLPMEDYALLLFRLSGQEIKVYQKIYPLIVQESTELYHFIAGSALIPYLERLEGTAKADFIQGYKRRITQAFPHMPALYPFKRILMGATF